MDSVIVNPDDCLWAGDGEAVAALTAQLAHQTAALENALRTKDEFLRMVNHELRTPLTVILGWTRMLRSGRVGSEQWAHGLEIIERHAAAEARLIEDLLDESRILQGGLQLAVGPVDLADVVTCAVDALRLAAAPRGIRVTATLDQEAGVVSGDRERLAQVISSVLANAVKFSADDGRVDVALSRVGPMLRVAVSDRGAGIVPALLPFVFERFRQGDQSTTRRHGGAGLGLSIARHVVELHGGTLTAESEGEGRGATFTMSIPQVAAPHDEPAVRHRHREAARRWLRRRATSARS